MNKSNQKYTKHQMLLRTRSESGAENVHYPIMYKELSERDKLYAEQELNETEENKAEGMRKLKAYIKKEGLTCADDNYLIIVLRNCKYDITKSESKLKRFLRLRQLIIKKVAKIDMKKIEFMLNDFHAGSFPWRDSYGRQLSYTRPNIRLDKYEAEDIIYFGLAEVLFALQFPLSSIYGVVHIGDNKPLLISYYQMFKILRQALPFLVDMPFRISKLHVVNEHSFARWLVNMLRPFLPEKVRNRVVFHGSNFGSLHKLYHPDILPEELGGTLGPMSCKHYRDDFLKFIKSMTEIHQNV